MKLSSPKQNAYRSNSVGVFFYFHFKKNPSLAAMNYV
jgi:hypothetical protein